MTNLLANIQDGAPIKFLQLLNCFGRKNKLVTGLQQKLPWELQDKEEEWVEEWHLENLMAIQAFKSLKDGDSYQSKVKGIGGQREKVSNQAKLRELHQTSILVRSQEKEAKQVLQQILEKTLVSWKKPLHEDSLPKLRFNLFFKF